MKESLLDRKGTKLAPEFKEAYAAFRAKEGLPAGPSVLLVSSRAWHAASDAYWSSTDPISDLDSIKDKVRNSEVIKRRTGTYLVKNDVLGCRIWRVGGNKVCTWSGTSKSSILKTIRRMEAKLLLDKNVK